MAEENRKSLLTDILKRERLEKSLGKDKNQGIKAATGLIKNKSDQSTGSSSSKDLYDRVNNSKASSTYDTAIEEALLDIRYYFLKEGEYSDKFRKLYMDNRSNLEKYGIDARKYLEYARESFDRYKKINRMMPLDPMKPKAYKYVETSMLDLIKMLAQKFGK